jgi:hypothetical protein
MLRVQKPTLEAILERLEHGLPIHAGRFHPDQRDPELRQPLAERRKPSERRTERPCLLIPAAPTGARNADGRDDVGRDGSIAAPAVRSPEQAHRIVWASYAGSMRHQSDHQRAVYRIDNREDP